MTGHRSRAARCRPAPLQANSLKWFAVSDIPGEGLAGKPMPDGCLPRCCLSGPFRNPCHETAPPSCPAAAAGQQSFCRQPALGRQRPGCHRARRRCRRRPEPLQRPEGSGTARCGHPAREVGAAWRSGTGPQLGLHRRLGPDAAGRGTLRGSRRDRTPHRRRWSPLRHPVRAAPACPLEPQVPVPGRRRHQWLRGRRPGPHPHPGQLGPAGAAARLCRGEHGRWPPGP